MCTLYSVEEDGSDGEGKGGRGYAEESRDAIKRKMFGNKHAGATAPKKGDSVESWTPHPESQPIRTEYLRKIYPDFVVPMDLGLLDLLARAHFPKQARIYLHIYAHIVSV